MRKTIIRLLINTGIGAGLILLWMRLVPLDQVLTKLAESNPWVVLAGSLFLALGGILRGMRLYYVLPEKSVSFKDSVLITSISQLLSFVIPVRLGEVTKGVYISTQSKLPFAKSVIWIFLDRFIDFWVVVTTVLVLTITINVSFAEELKLTLIGLTALMTLGIITTIYYPKVIKKIVDLVLTIVFISRIKNLLKKFTDFVLDCFAVLPKRFDKQLIIISLTILSWIFEGLAWFVIFQSLSVDGVTFQHALLGALAITLSFLIPSAPGYVGSLQASSIAIFSFLLGFDQITVSAAAVLFNLVMLLSVLIAGIPAVYFLKFDLRLVTDKLKQLRS